MPPETPYYLLTEVEVTDDPLPAVVPARGERGVGLVLRRKGRPVGFVLHELPRPGAPLTPADLPVLIAGNAGEQIVREALREGLAVNGDTPPRPRPVSVTATICTRDHPDLLARCLASLRDLDQPGPDRLAFFEVLVVDNAPPDDRTRELVAATEGVSGLRYTCEPLPGLDFARNRALAEARGEVVAFLDDDAVADRHWLSGLVDACAEDPDAAAFTGLVLPLALDTPAQVTFERRGGFRRGFERVRFGGTRHDDPWYPSGTGFGAGCCMAFRRDALLALGGFDEALDTGRPLPGGGDLDVFYRVVRAGHRLVYEPGFLVFHEHRATHAGLRRQFYTWGLGFLAFVAKARGAEDGEERRKLGWLARWFFADALSRLWRSVRGRDVLSPDLVAAELAGGMVGLCGEYARSRRRVARLRRDKAVAG